MGADDPAVYDLVEVVRPDLGLATGRRDAEQLAGVDAVHRGAHADHSVSVFAASADDLLDDDAEVAEGLAEPLDQGPRSGAAGLLAGPQRDVVLVVGEDGVEQFWLAAEGLVESTDEVVDGCGHDHSWFMLVAATCSRPTMVSVGRMRALVAPGRSAALGGSAVGRR
jgi:hypothetical protein